MTRIDELIARTEIQDVLTRYAQGIDRMDLELVRSCYHDDARHEGMFRGDPDAFVALLADESFLPAFVCTTHHIGRFAIEVRDDVAWAETSCIAFHRGTDRHPWGARDVTMGVRYVDRFERREGRWAIAHRQVVHDWIRADPIAATIKLPGAPWGRRDRDDPSYRRD